MVLVTSVTLVSPTLSSTHDFTQIIEFKFKQKTAIYRQAEQYPVLNMRFNNLLNPYHLNYLRNITTNRSPSLPLVPKTVNSSSSQNISECQKDSLTSRKYTRNGSEYCKSVTESAYNVINVLRNR